MIERNTHQKNAIIEELKNTTAHPTALELYDKLSKRTDVSRATVFRILKDLTEKGVIQKIKITDSNERYDYNVEEHYHFKCNCCGRVFDVNMKYQKHINRHCKVGAGFLVQGHHIEFFGLCRDCLKK